jgi:hypothetical protein
MTEQSIGNEQQTCAHAKCSCLVPIGQKFCSDYCAVPDDAQTASLQGKAACKCGHSECKGG